MRELAGAAWCDRTPLALSFDHPIRTIEGRESFQCNPRTV
jgi:hypothetical protein